MLDAFGSLEACFASGYDEAHEDLAPAIEAASTPPGATLRQGALLEAQPLPLRALGLAGAGSLALAALAAWWTTVTRLALGGQMLLDAGDVTRDARADERIRDGRRGALELAVFLADLVRGGYERAG